MSRMASSAAIVLLQVVLGRPRYLFPDGVHLRGALALDPSRLSVAYLTFPGGLSLEMFILPTGWFKSAWGPVVRFLIVVVSVTSD